MAQHDMVIDNGPGLAVRTDINAAVQALVSQSSGPVEPTTKYAGMLWLDTTVAPDGLLRQRNQANSAWIALRSGTIIKAPSVQVFTSSNPSVAIPAGCTHFEIEEVVGGGGAGGGGVGNASGAGAGGGGASGAYSRGQQIFDVAALGISTIAIAIGAGGTVGAAGAAGNAGGTTTVTIGGTTHTWGGGGGGAGGAVNGTAQLSVGGSRASAGSMVFGSWNGEIGVSIGAGVAVAGAGGSCPLGYGGISQRFAATGGNGQGALGYGAGGGGGGAAGTVSSPIGGPGAPGYVRIKWHYGLTT